MKIILHHGDLDSSVTFEKSVAIDTEALGLQVKRDPLCLVQLSGGDGVCHLVKFDLGKPYKAPHLKKILENKNILKIYHYARFDVSILKQYLEVCSAPNYCTKIASKLARTYTERHGLKDLCSTLLNVEISKQERCSNWGADILTEEQKMYAATDVLYLHQLKDMLDEMLKKNGRKELAEKCFEFIPTCVDLDLQGWDVGNIFAYK
jgi:ribonuclease D